MKIDYNYALNEVYKYLKETKCVDFTKDIKYYNTLKHIPQFIKVQKC